MHIRYTEKPLNFIIKIGLFVINTNNTKIILQ